MDINWTRGYIGLVCFSLLGLGLTRGLRLDPGAIAPVTAALTLIVGVIAIFHSVERSLGARTYRALVVLVLLGTAVELIGVRTGFPFGRYAYTDRWRPLVALPGVGLFPLQVPLAWTLMVGACTFTLVRVGIGSWPKWAYALCAGLLCAIIDLAMEPVMTERLGYWRWLEPGPLPGGAPILNCFGWFLTASLGAAILLAFGARAAFRNADATLVLVGHLVLLAGIGVLAR
jgi:uncharacterized membrane protein